jgi:hypothetical protein
MTTRVFTDEELERRRTFRRISRKDVIRFFTPTPADVEVIDPARRNAASGSPR